MSAITGWSVDRRRPFTNFFIATGLQDPEWGQCKIPDCKRGRCLTTSRSYEKHQHQGLRDPIREHIGEEERNHTPRRGLVWSL